MWQEAYLERFYPQTSWRRDGTRDFFKLVERNCHGKILEIGAGPSNPFSERLAAFGEVHGIDVDPETLNNSALTSATVVTDRMPFPDCSFDSCFSNYVCEHLEDPVLHLSEVWRVLKPEGAYCFRTPGRFHYTSIVSNLTPHAFHVQVANKLRAIEGHGHDPYPTKYKLNGKKVIERIAGEVGFRVEKLQRIEREPSYGMSARSLFLLFTAYERIVNSSELFALFRSTLLVVLHKPASLLSPH